VIQALQKHDWPGNVRELENVLQRAIILSHGGTLSLADDWISHIAPVAVGDGGQGATLLEVSRRHILHVLGATRWRIEGRGGAAHVLGLRPSTLRSRMSKLGLVRPR
jgi:transcriptional regulator of acetoin/glycerol metabolism